MDHTRIEAEGTIDRYLTGRLTAAEESLFEEHLIQCPGCLEKVRWGEQLMLGLRETAAQDVARTTTGLNLVAWLAGRSRLARSLAVAVSAGTVVLVALLAWQVISLRHRVASLRASAGDGQLAGPSADLVVLSLGASRSDVAPVPTLELFEQPHWILLSVELPAVDYSGYRLTLLAPDGSVLWRGDGLQPTLYDSLLVTVHSSILGAGEYRLRIEGETESGGAEGAGEVRFRLTEPARP